MTMPYDDCSPDLLRYTLFDGEEAPAELRLGLRRQGALCAVAIGALNARSEGPSSGHVKLVATRPDCQRRGYARRLLEELEGRLRSAGVNVVQVSFSRRYLVPGVDLRHSKALCLFDRLGYERRPFTYNLNVDLSTRSFDPTPHTTRLQAEGIVVRRVQRGDEERFNAYLGERWSAGWQYEGMYVLRSGQDPIPGHIALVGQDIVGFSVYDATRPGWLGPIGTNAELRGRDVGTALLHACLYDWQCQGRHWGEIAGIGPLYFYVTSCDATICRTWQRYEKTLAADANATAR